MTRGEKKKKKTELENDYFQSADFREEEIMGDGGGGEGKRAI